MLNVPIAGQSRDVGMVLDPQHRRLVVLRAASGCLGAFMRASHASYGVAEGRPLWKTVPQRIAMTLAVVALLVTCAAGPVFTGTLATRTGVLGRLAGSAVVSSRGSASATRRSTTSRPGLSARMTDPGTAVKRATLGTRSARCTCCTACRPVPVIGFLSLRVKLGNDMDHDGNDPIDVTRTTTTRALVVQVTGDIDMATFRAADTSLRVALVALPPPWLVVMDLTGVGFFGATGVRLLRQWIDACADREVRVHLVVAPESLALRVFKIVGLHEDVPTFHDVGHALGTG